jgi:hypothetical protein
MPLLKFVVNECAELPLLAAFLAAAELLAGVGLVLVGMVKSLKCCVGVRAVIRAASTSLWFVVLAFL